MATVTGLERSVTSVVACTNLPGSIETWLIRVFPCRNVLANGIAHTAAIIIPATNNTPPTIRIIYPRRIMLSSSSLLFLRSQFPSFKLIYYKPRSVVFPATSDCGQFFYHLKCRCHILIFWLEYQAPPSVFV